MSFKNFNRNIRVIIFTLIINLLSLFSTYAHPIHISVTNMDITADNALVFSIKLFTDDLEQIVNTKYHTHISIQKDQLKKEDCEVLERYVRHHFRIDIGNKKWLKYEWEKIKFTEQAVYLYFRSEDKVPFSNQLKINNTLMCDLYENQSNLLILSDKTKKEQGYKYTKEDYSFTFKINE